MYCCKTLFSLDEQRIYSYFDNYGDDNVMPFLIYQFSDNYEKQGIDLNDLDCESKNKIKDMLKQEFYE
ncbi:MAG: hypothetical protein GF317_22380 [Candidatus Lokiarchaeota archaeon]|nr:hypothetical protein [Candidatus Lokiarchaeota archaeon]MBD3202208.1 hypothetical protein [Candidatus Lokiarchaeota archaeon]